MKDKPDYNKQWSDLTSRMVMFFIAWLAGFFVAVAGIMIFHPPGLLLLVPWAAACVWASYRWAYVRCPRCGQLFFKKPMVVNTYVRKCMHCGLEKWSNE